MKKGQVILAASLGLILTACAGSKTGNNQEQKVAENNNDRVCTKQVTVGSHFKKKRCMSKQQAEQERLQSQELLRQGSAQGSTLPNKN
jgi:protein involved in sex pheromone biosynthesis